MIHLTPAGKLHVLEVALSEERHDYIVENIHIQFPYNIQNDVMPLLNVYLPKLLEELEVRVTPSGTRTLVYQTGILLAEIASIGAFE